MSLDIAKARAVKSEHKALGVVCFGYFRYRNARFGCAEVHQAIQCMGRDSMTRARTLAQQEGFRMVHELTDCLFLQKKGTDGKFATVAKSRTAGSSSESLSYTAVAGTYRILVKSISGSGDFTACLGVP